MSTPARRAQPVLCVLDGRISGRTDWPGRLPGSGGNRKGVWSMEKVKVRARRPGAATGQTVRKGKNFTIKRGSTTARPAAYPVQTCATRWKDAESGQWTSRPADQAAPVGRTRKGRTDAAVLSRRVVTHGDGSREVIGARVTLGSLRGGQRAGKVKKADVRAAERELSREYLEQLNPERARLEELEAQRAGYNSDRAKRGATTKAKNKAAGIKKKTRPAVVVRTELLRTEELVRDAMRRHDRAKTAKTRTSAAQTLAARRARLQKLKAELKKAE